MIHQLIEPSYYGHLLSGPDPIVDWPSYFIACVALMGMIAIVVWMGAVLFRLLPSFQSTLNAYCRGRIAWAYGCLFAMALCLGDLSFIVLGKHLSSIWAATPYYTIILLLTVGVILHKGYVRKDLRRIQEFSK